MSDTQQITINEILARLPDHSRDGGGYRASCPVHGGADSGRSLKIDVKDGQVLLHCHVGCSQDDLMAWAKGDQIYNPPPAPKAKRKKKWNRASLSPVIHWYQYHDEDGHLLYEHGRRENKADGFPFRRTGKNGRHIWNKNGVEFVLYHLPELLAADGDIFITEGEKDADNLRRLGLTATTNADGAGKWKPQYTESLTGRDVIITPDNDESGRDHAQLVAEQLHGKASSIRIVELPGLGNKQDVSDWLAMGNTAEDLLLLARDTARYVPEQAEEEKPSKFYYPKPEPRAGHTCLSGGIPGTAITIRMTSTSVRKMSDHDWKHCEECRADYILMRSNYLEDVREKIGPLTVTKFKNEEEWTTTRKRWDKRHERGGERVSGVPYYQDDGSVIVAHTSQDEPGEPSPDDLSAAVDEWTTSPSDTKTNRAYNSIESDWHGTRPSNKKDDEPSYQLRTNAPTVIVAKRILNIELEYHAKGNIGGKRDIDCRDAYINLHDMLSEAKESGVIYSLDEPHPQGMDNPVVAAIFNDPLVKEVIGGYSEPAAIAQAEPLPEPDEADPQIALPLETSRDVAAIVHWREPYMDNTGDIPPPPVADTPQFVEVFG